MNEWRFFCPNSGNKSWQVWVSLRGKTKMAECKLADSKLLSLSIWVIMNESDWISLSQSQSGVRVFLSVSERRKWGVWIQHSKIQDDCHHQVKWEWMSLSQIVLVSIRVKIEWECFWVNLREENKVPESKMAVSEPNMAEFKMAANIMLSENEWVKFFFCKMAESKMAVSESNMAEFKMAAIIKLSQNELVKFFFVQNGWIQYGRVQDVCHHEVESEWMSEGFFFVQIVGTNLGKCDWVWEGKLRWMNVNWQIQNCCPYQFEW